MNDCWKLICSCPFLTQCWIAIFYCRVKKPLFNSLDTKHKMILNCVGHVERCSVEGAVWTEKVKIAPRYQRRAAGCVERNGKRVGCWRQVRSRHSLIHRLNPGDRNSNKGHFVVRTGLLSVSLHSTYTRWLEILQISFNWVLCLTWHHNVTSITRHLSSTINSSCVN